MKNRVLAVMLVFVLLLTLFAGCNKKENNIAEILTQKTSGDGKIDVTVLVKYAFGIDVFEKEAEKRFPNLNIIQVGNYTSDMGIEEYKARLEHDDLTDIVMTWPKEVGEEYLEDRLLDLSTFSAASKYTTKSLNRISYSDGKLYYLPGPSQVRGIVYNKTMFKENGWSVPNSFEGFVDLCKTIENSGMRSLQLGLANSEVLDTAFVGYGFESSFANPKSAQNVELYNQGIGSFADNFMPALETFQRLVDENILQPSDLTVSYSKRENMLFSRQCAMIEDSVLMARMGETLTGTKDEFALMPFFNEGEDNDWARLYNVCFIGLNKHLEDKGNEQKFDLVKQLVDYISTVEGQQALAGDTGAMFSNLKESAPSEVAEIEDLKKALNAGRYGVFPTLKNAQDALREGLAGIVAKTHTIDDVVKMVDAKNKMKNVVAAPLVVGTAKDDFTLIETGNFITDVLRKTVEADFALFLDNGKDGLYNGKGVSGRIYKGDITLFDIKRILPDLKHGEQGVLQKVSMTGKNLLQTVENAIQVDNEKSGWFYYFSGLRMEFDPLAENGSRIKSVTDDKGRKIEDDKIYTIAVMDETVPKEFIVDLFDTGIQISYILETYIAKADSINPSYDNRFVISKNNN